MGSILQAKKRKAIEAPVDQVYVIYGKAGSGKTVLASKNKKTNKRPAQIIKGAIAVIY